MHPEPACSQVRQRKHSQQPEITACHDVQMHNQDSLPHSVHTLVSRTRFKPIIAKVCSQRALDLARLTSGGRLRRAAKRSVSHTDSVCTAQSGSNRCYTKV